MALAARFLARGAFFVNGAFCLAALFSAQRFLVASTILFRPSALSRRFLTAGFGFPDMYEPALLPDNSRSAAMARSMAAFCSSSSEIMLSTFLNESP